VEDYKADYIYGPESRVIEVLYKKYMQKTGTLTGMEHLLTET
jgi:hypothetical protein